MLIKMMAAILSRRDSRWLLLWQRFSSSRGVSSSTFCCMYQRVCEIKGAGRKERKKRKKECKHCFGGIWIWVGGGSMSQVVAQSPKIGNCSLLLYHGHPMPHSIGIQPSPSSTIPSDQTSMAATMSSSYDSNTSTNSKMSDPVKSYNKLRRQGSRSSVAAGKRKLDGIVLPLDDDDTFDALMP